MVKKSIVAGAALVLLLGLCFGRNALSYVTTGVGKVSSAVKDSVPINFEIDRAHKMVKELTPEIRRNMHVIAREEIELERLEKRSAETEKRLAQDRDEIFHLKTELDKGHEYYHLAGHRYSANEVKTDVANRFKEYKTDDATSLNLRKVVQARRRSLSAARQKLNGMLAARRQLQVDIENLEARLKMVEVAQTTSIFNFDDSHLARTRELVQDIQTRIDVAERLIGAERNFHDRIPLEEPEVEDVSDQITEYFDSEPDMESLADLSTN